MVRDFLRVPQALPVPLTVAFALGLTLPTTAPAQQVHGLSEPANRAARPPSSGMTSVTIAADADSDAKKSDLEKALKLAVKLIGATCQSIRVEAVTRERYEGLKQIIQGGEQESRPKDFGPEVRRYVGRKDDNLEIWELDLGGPYLLDSLSIEYEGPEKPENLKPSDESGPLQYASLGRYIITLPRGKNPKAYAMEMRDGTRKIPSQRREWPKEDSHWLINIEGFTGDLVALFEKLTEVDEVGVPLYGFRSAPERRLILGSAKFDPDTGPTTFTENTVNFHFNVLTKLKPRRVLMLFPLNQHTKDQMLAKYSSMGSFDLSEAVNDSERVKPDHDVKLTPDLFDQPRWFEVPLVANELGGGFDRRFKFDRINDWKALKPEDLRVWRLFIYEFEAKDGTRRALPSVQGGAASQTKGENRGVFVRPEEITEWPLGIRDLSAR
jgi:hypothetical protein